MPCNQDTCSQYSPQNDPEIGIQMERGIYPYPAGTRRINAPSWDRDRIMYDFEDVCSAVVPSSRYSTSSVTSETGVSTGYGFNSINNAGDNNGKLYSPLSTGNWWETYRACQATTLTTYPAYSGSVERTRYWNHYPTEISFEPIFSDTWFYYLFDTLNGVTGTPCAAYCFTVTYLYAAATGGGKSGGGTDGYVSYVYNVTKTPYECPCTPDESYIRYTLEDGLTNPAYNQDPYPTFWTIGTKRNAIAFKYATKTAVPGSLVSGAILRFRPPSSSETNVIYKYGSKPFVWIGPQSKPFFSIAELPLAQGQPISAFTQSKLVFRSYTTNVTCSNGMGLNITIEGRTGGKGTNTYAENGFLYLKVNSITSLPTGGWPASATTVSLQVQSPDFGSHAPIFGDIIIEPVNTGRYLPGKRMGVPRDFAFRESKFIGGLYAVTNPLAGQWSSWFNSYAVWTNDKQRNLVGREMTIVNRKLPVSAGTYTLEHGIDNYGTIQIKSWGVQREDGEQVLSDNDEDRIIAGGAFNAATPASTTFTVTKSGYINLICKIGNAGTDTSWTTNPGGYAVVIKKDSQIVWTTRDAITGENGGDCYRGMTLSEAKWVDAWDGNNGIPFRSSGPISGRCWKSNNVVVYKDYQIPGGLLLRVKLQSEWNSDENRYNTIWKIVNVLKNGEDYQPGNGVDWIDQQKFTMFYPTTDDPERISITILISETVDSGDALPDDLKRISTGMTVGGWSISDVRESNDELNLHFAEIRGGTTDFVKDATYTVSNGQNIIVKAGWGIKDRACLIGLYEFRKKEIEYGVGVPTPGVPFSPELIKPKCAAQIENGRVVGIQIVSRGRGLNNRNIETPTLVVEPPPTYFNHDLYNELLNQGVTVEKAKNRCKGTGKVAKLKPVFRNGRLFSVEVIDGGSGYSSTNPPNVFVPYIAKNETNIVRPQQNQNEIELGSKQVFEKSPIFQNFAKTNYDKATYSIDPTTGSASITGSVKASGYNWNEYTKQTEQAHKEVSFNTKKVDIETMTFSDTQRTARYEDRGIDKKFIQSFKPGGSARNNSNVNLIKSKTSDKIIPPNPSLISEKQSNIINSYVSQVDKSDDKYQISPYSEPTTLGPTALSNSTNVDSSAKDAYKQFSDSSTTSKVTLSLPSEAEGNVTYTRQFRTFTEQMGAGTPYALDTSAYKNTQQIIVRKDSGKYIKTIPTILDYQEKTLSDTLDEMWQRDLETNRIGTWNNTEMRVTKQSFFNLPCRSDSEIYLMRRFCPDPRPWTTISIRLGVIKNMPDPNNPELTVCKKCLQDQPALVTLRNSLRSQFGDNNLDVEDAYCVQFYGFPTYAWYDQDGGGLGDGYNNTTYAVPFGESGFAAGNYFAKSGSLRSFTGYQQSDTEYPDGCRSYEINGRLLIYHSLTNETNLWARAVSSYGNPYDFICNREYGDEGEEEIYITEDAINTETSDASEMPGNYIYNINGQNIDSGISQTVPEEGY
jgi:hypothetical protein